MKKVVLTFGSISGVLVSVLMVINMAICTSGEKPDFSNGEIWGYTSMLLALSAIYFGIRSYRDKYLGGTISFGKAFVTGLYIVLVASAFYVVTWMFYSETAAGNEFMEHYMNYSIEKIKSEGGTPAEIETHIKEANEFMEMYKNPLVKIGFTFMEIFPVGLIVSLICGGILKKSPAVKE